MHYLDFISNKFMDPVVCPIITEQHLEIQPKIPMDAFDLNSGQFMPVLLGYSLPVVVYMILLYYMLSSLYMALFGASEEKKKEN